ncbi:Dihydrodipicolinate synthase [Cryptotrichosporon argae]
MSLSNPLNLALLGPIAYLVYRTVFPSIPVAVEATSYNAAEYNWAPAAHPSVLCYRTYTPRSLAEYDGKGERILLAIMRVRAGKFVERTVFDVSAGRSFYGPDGVYGNFAGRDASRGMAKQSFDDDMITPLDQPMDTLQDLTKAEIDNMRGWHEHFERKYIVCGELVEEDSA